MVKTPKPLDKGYTVYGRAGCPYCEKAVELLKDKNKKFRYFQRERLEAGRYQFHRDLKSRIGKYGNTFPLVFCNGKFLGGYDELSTKLDGLTVNF